MKTIGQVLLVLGLLALVYGGIDYNRNRTAVQLGSLRIDTAEHHSVPIPAVAGLAVLVGGIAFLVAGKRGGMRS